MSTTFDTEEELLVEDADEHQPMADYITQCGGAAAANSALPKQSIGTAKSTTAASSAAEVPATPSMPFTVPSAARPTHHRALRILNSINSAKRNARRS
jgi:hypothetical protein